jgi:hypothetical protein
MVGMWNRVRVVFVFGDKAPESLQALSWMVRLEVTVLRV